MAYMLSLTSISLECAEGSLLLVEGLWHFIMFTGERGENVVGHLGVKVKNLILTAGLIYQAGWKMPEPESSTPGNSCTIPYLMCFLYPSMFQI